MESICLAFENLKNHKACLHCRREVDLLLGATTDPMARTIMDYVGPSASKLVQRTLQHALLRLQLDVILFVFMPPYSRGYLNQMTLEEWTLACLMIRDRRIRPRQQLNDF